MALVSEYTASRIRDALSKLWTEDSSSTWLSPESDDPRRRYLILRLKPGKDYSLLVRKFRNRMEEATKELMKKNGAGIGSRCLPYDELRSLLSDALGEDQVPAASTSATAIEYKLLPSGQKSAKGSFNLCLGKVNVMTEYLKFQ